MLKKLNYIVESKLSNKFKRDWSYLPNTHKKERRKEKKKKKRSFVDTKNSVRFRHVFWSLNECNDVIIFDFGLISLAFSSCQL